MRINIRVPCFLYYSLKLLNQNQSSSNTACATDVFDFLLDFLEEPTPNLTKPLSRASGVGYVVGGETSSSIASSDLTRIGRLELTDSFVDSLMSSSHEIFNISLELLNPSLVESLLSSGSDGVAPLSGPIPDVRNFEDRTSSRGLSYRGI